MTKDSKEVMCIWCGTYTSLAASGESSLSFCTFCLEKLTLLSSVFGFSLYIAEYLIRREKGRVSNE